jgi:hypothetical protein
VTTTRACRTSSARARAGARRGVLSSRCRALRVQGFQGDAPASATATPWSALCDVDFVVRATGKPIREKDEMHLWKFESAGSHRLVPPRRGHAHARDGAQRSSRDARCCDGS